MTRIDKNTLRQTAQTARRQIPTDLRQTYSRSICRSLMTLNKDNANLLTYRALPSEVDTANLFTDAHCRIYAPVTHNHQHMAWHLVDSNTQWQKGIFGVDEPAQGELWTGGDGTTMLACPLVAFDRSGNRLGMGKGCFDYWLAQYHEAIDLVIGIAFSCQEVAAIPAEQHDIPMHYIITEKEVIPCLKR